MRKSLLWVALATAGFVQSGLAMAEEAAPAPDWTIGGSVSFVSDYIFRGQSQTWGKPAAQFGVEANHKSGFYAGFAASNVSDEWLAGANLETDLYAGYRGKISSLGFDVGGIFYIYPGADWDQSNAVFGNKSQSLNTFELYGSLSYNWLSVKSGVTLTDYFGWNENNSGRQLHGNNPAGVGDFTNDPKAGVDGDTKGSWYIETNAAYEVAPGWTVSGQIGRQFIADSHGLDISYYKAGVTKAFNGGWAVGVFASASSDPKAYEKFWSLRDNSDTADIAKSTGYISISKSF